MYMLIFTPQEGPHIIAIMIFSFLLSTFIFGLAADFVCRAAPVPQEKKDFRTRMVKVAKLVPIAAILICLVLLFGLSGLANLYGLEAWALTVIGAISATIPKNMKVRNFHSFFGAWKDSSYVRIFDLLVQGLLGLVMFVNYFNLKEKPGKESARYHEAWRAARFIFGIGIVFLIAFEAIRLGKTGMFQVAAYAICWMLALSYIHLAKWEFESATA